MAETGGSKDEALALARQMQGPSEDAVLRLPLSERPLIELALATVGRWRWIVGIGGAQRVGFDLGEVEVAARWMGLTPDVRLFEGLWIIERAVLRKGAA